MIGMMEINFRIIAIAVVLIALFVVTLVLINKNVIDINTFLGFVRGFFGGITRA